ncbi:MAG TPA: periplasmic heavy metal sensor [Bauldia sp.]|nr:periplasmic heavy metal sensor [Bauldia sp.]
MTDIVVPRRRRIPWLFIGFAASLVLNAFFLGAIATEVFRFSAAGKPHVNFELRWIEERLAEKDFSVVASAVAAARPDAERHIARLRALRQEIAALAAVPEPDRAAIDSKLAEIRAEQTAMVSSLQTTIIDALLALPASSREALGASPGAEGR